jgi:hypothetical protein
MWNTLKSLLESKKAMMAFLSMVVWVVGRVGLDLDVDVLAGAVAPLWAYIFGQGIADHGKAVAEIQAANRPADRQPTDQRPTMPLKAPTGAK